MLLWNSSLHTLAVGVFVVLGSAVWQPWHLYESSLIPAHSGRPRADGWLHCCLMPAGPPLFRRGTCEAGGWLETWSKWLNELLCMMEGLAGCTRRLEVQDVGFSYHQDKVYCWAERVRSCWFLWLMGFSIDVVYCLHFSGKGHKTNWAFYIALWNLTPLFWAICIIIIRKHHTSTQIKV